MLKLWANIFNSTGFMKGNPLFIVDDEADAASLNTLVNRDKSIPSWSILLMKKIVGIFIIGSVNYSV